MANDSGVGGLQVTSITFPDCGTTVLTAGGEITYTPEQGYDVCFTDYDNFTYTITDQMGNTATGEVHVSIDNTGFWD